MSELGEATGPWCDLEAHDVRRPLIGWDPATDDQVDISHFLTNPPTHPMCRSFMPDTMSHFAAAFEYAWNQRPDPSKEERVRAINSDFTRSELRYGIRGERFDLAIIDEPLEDDDS
jgi:hypothetical protein